uniref:Uncharacterized protein n=1 Tax=Nonomuraea gerenzanensis TaxID=93944 RepID=A0A1M4EDL3_9ACTN|nr:hypothetical protein BN4615_P6380 [Nonomuraea gerenzanensis]
MAGRPISVSSTRPKISLTTSGGVDVTLKLAAKLPFAYDPATSWGTSSWITPTARCRRTAAPAGSTT